MSRRNPSLLEVFILLPWWISASLAVVVYFGAPIFSEAFLKNSSAISPMVGVLQIVFPILLGLASIASLVRSWKTNRNLETQKDIESLKRLHWKDFEDLLGEVYRRQGYSVEEQLGGGADGGVDLVLHANGKTTLVQCKRRTNKPVPVQTVRELYGVMAAEKAQAGILAATSTFTSEARRFASGKPIELIDGPELLRLVRSVQTEGIARERCNTRAIAPSAIGESNVWPGGNRSGSSAEHTTRKEEERLLQGSNGETEGRLCPACGSAMVLRTAKKGTNAGNQFWGCSAFPKCRHVKN